MAYDKFACLDLTGVAVGCSRHKSPTYGKGTGKNQSDVGGVCRQTVWFDRRLRPPPGSVCLAKAFLLTVQLIDWRNPDHQDPGAYQLRFQVDIYFANSTKKFDSFFKLGCGELLDNSEQKFKYSQ